MFIELRSLPPSVWQEMVWKNTVQEAVVCRAGGCWLHPRQDEEVCGAGNRACLQAFPGSLVTLLDTRHGTKQRGLEQQPPEMCRVKGAPVCREAGKKP